MELEFDKEIDAILRRSRDSGTAVLTTGVSPHPDADTIAAFAENALPPKTKMLYMEHFADCDKCRRVLSQSILLNSEAVTGITEAASTFVSEPVAAVALPWYQRLFKSPNLALAMGAIVLAFSGILGFMLMQNRPDTSATEVSKAVEQQPVQGGPFYGGEADYQNSNTAAAAANAASVGKMPANATLNQSTPIYVSNSAANRMDASTGGKGVGRTEGVVTDGVSAEEAKPVAAPPPAPVPAGGQPAATAVDDKDAESKLKKENLEMSADRAKTIDERSARDTAAPSKKSAGPTRSGPANAQLNNQTQNVFNENLARSVGGKTFDNRSGVWYDLAYRNQSTTNVKRGSDEYKKLDSGLRSIADSLEGTVVVVWKSRAYRIQ